MLALCFVYIVISLTSCVISVCAHVM